MNGKQHQQDTDYSRDISNERSLHSPGYYHYSYPYYEDEIDLKECLGILWNWRTLIISITLLSMLTAGVLSFYVLKPVYEASTQIVASKDSMPNEVIKSPYFLAKVIDELELPDEESYTPFGLAKSISVEAGKSGNLTVIKIEDQNPNRAADIVNTVARLYTDFVREKNSESMTTTVAFLTEQRNNTQTTLNQTRDKLDKVRQSSKIDILKNEVERLAQELNQWKEATSIGSVRQEELTTGIKELENLLAETDETIPGPPDYAGNPTYIPNETYQRLATTLAEKKIELKELQVRLTQANSKIPVLESEYNLNYEQLLEADRNIKSLENTVERLTSHIMALDEKIVTSSTSIPEAVIAAPALAPMKPIKPRKMLNIAVSAILGAFVSVLIVFFAEYWRSPGESPEVKRG